MAKYSKKAQKKVSKVMHEYGEGKLKSGGRTKVKDRKQAVAIAISEARREGDKVPKKVSSAKKTSSKKTAAKATSKKAKSKKKTAAKKTASKKTTVKTTAEKSAGRKTTRRKA
ncbi:MAG: DUF6496 domain-containing protein [Bacteroidota bacterium]